MWPGRRVSWHQLSEPSRKSASVVSWKFVEQVSRYQRHAALQMLAMPTGIAVLCALPGADLDRLLSSTNFQLTTLVLCAGQSVSDLSEASRWFEDRFVAHRELGSLAAETYREPPSDTQAVVGNRPSLAVPIASSTEPQVDG